jgi:hypothetical protein
VSDNATRQINRGFVVEYNGEFFYASRNDVEINNPSTTDLNLNFATTQKNRLLFATTLLNIGSTRACNFYGDFFFVENLEPTSFQEDEGNEFLYNIGDFSACFRPNSIQEERIYKVCQYGVDILGGEEDNFDSNEYYLDHEFIDERRYVANKFTPFNLINYLVEAPNVEVTDNDGQTFDVAENYIDNLESGGVIRSISPYFHYFGVKSGKTSLDVAKNSFLC